MIAKGARHKALPYAIAGVLIGALLVHYVDWAFLKTTSQFIPSLTEIVCLTLVLLAVVLRLRQA